jgi:hypothetical protein
VILYTLNNHPTPLAGMHLNVQCSGMVLSGLLTNYHEKGTPHAGGMPTSRKLPDMKRWANSLWITG